MKVLCFTFLLLCMGGTDITVGGTDITVDGSNTTEEITLKCSNALDILQNCLELGFTNDAIAAELKCAALVARDKDPLKRCQKRRCSRALTSTIQCGLSCADLENSLITVGQCLGMKEDLLYLVTGDRVAKFNRTREGCKAACLEAEKCNQWIFYKGIIECYIYFDEEAGYDRLYHVEMVCNVDLAISECTLQSYNTLQNDTFKAEVMLRYEGFDPCPPYCASFDTCAQNKGYPLRACARVSLT